MSDTIDPKHTDKRTVERYINKGFVDEKAFEKHLKALPDLSDKAAPVEATSPTVEDDFDNEDDAE